MDIRTAVSLDLLEMNFGIFAVDTLAAIDNFLRDREELSNVIKDLYFEKMGAAQREREVIYDAKIRSAKSVFKKENKELKAVNLEAYREQKARYLFNIERLLFEEEKGLWTKERLVAPIFLKISDNEYMRDRWLEARLQSANLDPYELDNQRFVIENAGNVFLTWQNSESEGGRKPKPVVSIYRESISHLSVLCASILQGEKISEMPPERMELMKKEERTLLLVKSVTDVRPALLRVISAIKRLKDCCNYFKETPRRHDRLNSGRRGFLEESQNNLSAQKASFESLLEGHKNLADLKKRMPKSNLNIRPIYYPPDELEKLTMATVDALAIELLNEATSFRTHLRDFIAIYSVYIECDLDHVVKEKMRIKDLKIVQLIFENIAYFSAR